MGKKIRFIPTCCGLCLHYSWGEPEQFSDSKPEPLLRFIFEFDLFSGFAFSDKWYVTRGTVNTGLFTSTNYGISHHCMNTVLKLRASTCNLYILFKTLFCSCSNFFFISENYKVSSPNCLFRCGGNKWLCRLCQHKMLSQKVYLIHFYSPLKWDVKPCVHQWPTVCLLIFIFWYCLYVHGHY